MQSSLSLSVQPVSLLLRNLHYRWCGSFRFNRRLRTGGGGEGGVNSKTANYRRWTDSQGRKVHILLYSQAQTLYIDVEICSAYTSI